ncbi:CLUMA_CG013501, isoform A [Clunio marinus]|uniref:CLUMA_CG013501, isoform A n=1 Tax=Clunio marinus TaxID=568069 RepID=A0A1J1IJ26_9DIPT|nr:CLUMA_CG013501, isoform A [Clunio marinus]
MARNRKRSTMKRENKRHDESQKAKGKTKGKPVAKKCESETDWFSYPSNDNLTVLNMIISSRKSNCNNAKVIAELKKYYDKINHSDFIELFRQSLNMFLIHEQVNKTVLRIMLSLISRNIIDSVVYRMITTFLKDTSPLVRQNALKALQRLQFPDNPNDKVTKAYLLHMESDPVAKIADRIKILTTGLNDSSKTVKKTFHNVILTNWIASYNYNYVDFTKALKTNSSNERLLKFRSLAEDALSIVFT